MPRYFGIHEWWWLHNPFDEPAPGVQVLDHQVDHVVHRHVGRLGVFLDNGRVLHAMHEHLV